MFGELKTLIYIVIGLCIACLLTITILLVTSGSNANEEEKVEKKVSTIQERKDALKEVFK